MTQSLTTSPLTNIAGEAGDTTALYKQELCECSVPSSSLEASVEAIQATVVSKEDSQGSFFTGR